MDVDPSIVAQIDLQDDAPADRARSLARELIGIPRAPVGYQEAARLAGESHAYYCNSPYPWYHFSDWQVENRGPWPRCMPIVKTGIDRGARWLFGKPVQIQVPEHKPLEDWLRRQWTANRMQTRLLPAATRGGVEGGVAFKFSFDGANDDKPLSIDVLSVAQHVRCFFDPLDAERLLMARVQFEYQDPRDGFTYFHREEWTDEEQVTYIPQRATWVSGKMLGRVRWPAYPMIADGRLSPDEYEGWEIDDRTANPFGLIPVHPIRNIDDGDTIGIGDYWTVARVIDRINLTYHLMDRSNQFDSEPLLMFIDMALNPTDLTRSMTPGQPLDLKSDITDSGDPAKGQVVQMEARGALRPAMMEYARKLEKYVDDATGTVSLDAAEITNKGQMSQAVMSLTYAPLIETTHQKRRTYGEDGICKFLEKVTTGLRNAGAAVPELRGVDVDDPDKFSVTLVWPRMLPLSEEEKLSSVQRWQAEAESATMSHERIIERTAELEDVEDVDKLKKELASLSEARVAGLEQQVGPQDQLNEHDVADRTSQRAIGEFQGGVATRDEARKQVGKPPVGGNAGR